MKFMQPGHVPGFFFLMKSVATQRGKRVCSSAILAGIRTAVPKISQELLAEMVGTTRSRVSFFMNRFRKLGFIEYNGRLRVHNSLLNVLLHA